MYVNVEIFPNTLIKFYTLQLALMTLGFNLLLHMLFLDHDTIFYFRQH